MGFIFECGPQGADKKVCEHLTTAFFPDVEIVRSVTLTNKPLMIQNCGQQASILLAEGCDLVVIMWDLYPAWRKDGARPDCQHDRDQIRRQLAAHKVDDSRVRLLCLREELESWVLADERALSLFLSRTTREYKCKRVKAPETICNPKDKLCSIFSDAKRSKYSDLDHAHLIVQKLSSLDRLRRVQSFTRFEQLLRGNAPSCRRHLDE